MSYNAGTAWLAVTPSFDGVVKAIAAEATKWGEVAGVAFKTSFESQVQDLHIGVNVTGAPAAVAEISAITADRTVEIDPTISAGASAAYLAKVAALVGFAAAGAGAAGAVGGGGAGGMGLIGMLLWGGGGIAGFGAGFGSIMSLAGFGIEHLVTTILGLIGSLAGAFAGAALLAAGSLSILAVGMGSDMMVSMSAIADTKTLGTALAALNTATLQYGAGSAQAAAATANLNLQMALLGNTAGVLAELQLAKAIAALNSYWDQATSGARVAFVNMVTPLLAIAYTYIPLVAASATRNFGLITAGLQPVIAFLDGPAKSVFTNLENIFAARLPLAMATFGQGVQLVVNLLDYLANQTTGGFMQALFNELEKLNSPTGFAGLEKVVQDLIGMFRVWWDFAKQLFITLFDIFGLSKGLGTGIIQTLTQMLQKLDQWLTSTSGKNAVSNLFTVHKNEVIALFKALVPLIAAFGSLYLAIAPGLTSVVTVLVVGLTALLRLIVQMPGGVGAWTIAIILITAKFGLLGTAIDFLTAGAIAKLITSLGLAAVAGRDAAYSMLAAYAFATAGIIIDAAAVAIAWIVAGGWVVLLVAAMVAAVVLIVTHWQQVVNFFKALPGIIGTALTILAAIIEAPFIAAVNWVGGVPGMILNKLGNLGNLLFNAGKTIMNGLLNGIENAWNAVASFLGSLAGKIRNLKGPLDYDRVLLVPHGQALMQGLAQGLTEGFASSVVPALAKITSGFGGTTVGVTGDFGAIDQSIAKMASVGLSAGSVNLSGISLNSTNSRLDRLIAIATASPAQTGAAVSSKVSTQLGNVITQHAKTVQMLSRTGA